MFVIQTDRLKQGAKIRVFVSAPVLAKGGCLEFLVKKPIAREMVEGENENENVEENVQEFYKVPFSLLPN